MDVCLKFKVTSTISSWRALCNLEALWTPKSWKIRWNMVPVLHEGSSELAFHSEKRPLFIIKRNVFFLQQCLGDPGLIYLGFLPSRRPGRLLRVSWAETEPSWGPQTRVSKGEQAADGACPNHPCLANGLWWVVIQVTRTTQMDS